MSAGEDQLPGWNKNRVEALTDGIYAVAMTLLVIDLKLPDPHAITTEAGLAGALGGQIPKVVSWIISFFVLASFWLGHHRLFHHVRCVDRGLVWRNIVQVALISLVPFSTALIGEFGAMFLAQAIYDVNMTALSLVSLWKAHYLHRHPELAHHGFDGATYHATLIRVGGLLVIGLCAIAIAWWVRPVLATYLYILVIPIGRFSRRIEARAKASKLSHDAPPPASATPP